MWNGCPSLEFLIAQTQTSAEWHLLVSWACSLSTCWCDLFALWSFSSLFYRPGMWPFSKASYLAVPAPEPPTPSPKRTQGLSFCVCEATMKDTDPTHWLLSKPLSARQIFLAGQRVYVLWVKKDRGVGEEESSSRKSRIPAQASLACRLNSLICSGSLQGRCCPTLLQHVCSHACRDVSLTCRHAS